MAKKTFMKGALILGLAGIIIKLLGAFFRVPLTNIIGSEGMGYYQTAYPVYVLLLTISTAGIPTAIARLVSEKTALNQHAEAYRVFKLSFVLLFFIGITCSSVLFFGAEPIVKMITEGETDAVPAMKAIAPALLFVPMMASFRGYFQGRQDMSPTAASQVIEQLFRVVFGLGLAIYLVSFGLPKAAAGASFGATAGAIGGLVGIFIIFLGKHGRIVNDIAQGEVAENPESSGKILKTIILIAIPITIGAAIMPIMNSIDLAIVIRRLEEAGYSYDAANSMYGQLTGMAAPLLNLPQVLTQSLAMSLVPAIAAAHEVKDYEFMQYNTELGLRTAMIVGMPCAIGLIVLSQPIMLLLYPLQKESAVSAASCLAILAVGVVFLSSVQTLTGILQGVGKQMIPVRNLFIGAIAKVFITYFATSISSINVKGAAIGTVSAYIIASTLNLMAVRKYTGTRFHFGVIFLKPLISAAGMGIGAWAVYKAASMVFGNTISCMCGVATGVIVYVVLLFGTGGITADDLEKMPKGARLAKAVRKFQRNR